MFMSVDEPPYRNVWLKFDPKRLKLFLSSVSVADMSVSQWRADHGVVSNADFAFYFLTYEEALEEGGLEVAQAWAACHAAVGPGAAGTVRAVVANLNVPAPPSLRALGTPKVRPTSTPPWRPPPKVAPVPAKRPLPATTPLLTKNKAYRPLLEEILLTASVHREAFNRDSASKATTQPLVSKLLSSHSRKRCSGWRTPGLRFGTGLWHRGYQSMLCLRLMLLSSFRAAKPHLEFYLPCNLWPGTFTMPWILDLRSNSGPLPNQR